MSATFTIRLATVEDIATITRHRAEMFSDMGQLPASLYAELVAQTSAYLNIAIPAGEYVGWLASPEGRSESVVGGAGVQRRRVLPHPLTRDGQNRIASGNQAIVLNVFTEKAWRRQGLAALLMNHVLDWARAEALDTLVLHASDEGRPLYEKLGFVRTNEMRYGGVLQRGN
jgi:GNAT superfamily N-acetyltransferase